MTATAIHTATVERDIDASPADVYQAFTQADLLAQWFAPGAMRAEVKKLDARVGGQFRITMHEADSDASHTAYGEFVELDPPRKLVMTWTWETPGHGAENSLLTVTLTAKGDGTQVLLEHEKLADGTSVENHTKGWVGCLNNLADRISTFSA